MKISGIGERIADLREDKGWSQAELANRLGINKSVMNRIESEERPIRDYELDDIASIFKTSTDHLLGRSVSETPTTYQSTSMLKEIMDSLGISDLPFKDISKLNTIKEEDRREIIDHIRYIIQRASDRESN